MSELTIVRPDPPPSSPRRAIAKPIPTFDRWSMHPGHDLTPRKILSAFRTAEAGYPAQQCDMFEDVVERDAHLRHCLEKRLSKIAGKEWILQPGGVAELDGKVAAALEQAMRDVESTAPMFEHVMTALPYGYSATEVVWERRRVAGFEDLGDLWVPAHFATVPHRRILFDDRDGPRLVTTDSPTFAEEAEPLSPGSWVFARRRGRVAARQGLMRTAIWFSMFKTMSIRDWIIFAERFGLPYVTGEYEETASDEDKKVLEEAVQRLGTDGSAVFSSACEIVIHKAETGGKSTDVHGAITQLMNNEISKLVNGATLTSETQGPGSFALGRVHENASFDLVLDDERYLADHVQKHIGAPFVRFNGFPARAPRLKIHVSLEQDPKTRAEVASIFVNELGGDLDEEQMREEFQFKAPGRSALKGKPQPEAPIAPRRPPVVG
jgi:phage gp29-like protein